jgi:hypothetical protein
MTNSSIALQHINSICCKISKTQAEKKLESIRVYRDRRAKKGFRGTKQGKK